MTGPDDWNIRLTYFVSSENVTILQTRDNAIIIFRESHTSAMNTFEHRIRRM